MNIVDFTKKFQEIEIKYNFFDYKDKSGIAYWDIVRFDVFYEIYFDLNSTNTSSNIQKATSIPAKKNKIQKIKKLIEHFWSINFKTYDYIFFICSRYKNENGVNYDASAFDLLNRLDKQSLIFETFLRAEHYLHKGIINIAPDFAKIIRKITEGGKQYEDEHNVEDYRAMNTIISNEFNSTYNFEELIKESIKRYKFEHLYYLKLFKKVMPKRIFVVQNGIQKGMFAAAAELNIPLSEIQHGLIGYIHPAYSYPKSIKYGQLKALPETFLSFGSFWTEHLHFPVKKYIALGNSHLSKQHPKYVSTFDITFVFADIYTDLLIGLLKELLLLGYKGKICVKLHSNQYFQSSEIETLFSNYSNITIITNKETIEQVLSTSQAIVAIQSTVVYQALHNKVRVFLYKRLDYDTHFDVFDDPLVSLFDTVNQLVECIKMPTLNDLTSPKCYFETFHDDVFQKLLKNAL